MDIEHRKDIGLERFIEAQNKWNTYQITLDEIKSGRKKTHWIWYIFPQMAGLGCSSMSKFYGIRGREEAQAYITHPLLRARLVEITEIVYNSCNIMFPVIIQQIRFSY